MNYIDLFSGIGGFALGAYWAGMKFDKHYFSEIDPYCIELYQKRFPDAIPLGDIRSIDCEILANADRQGLERRDSKELREYTSQRLIGAGNSWLITGGFPCQDISVAGKGAGIRGSRSGLWFEMWRIIRDLRPCYVIAENVGAITRRGLDVVLSSLAEIGYDAEWTDIRASDVGAPHRRERIWIVAYPRCGSNELERISRISNKAATEIQREMGEQRVWATIANSSQDVADTEDTNGRRAGRTQNERRRDSQIRGRRFSGSWLQHRAAKSRLGRRADGLHTWMDGWEEGLPRLASKTPHRVDRLKGLGNAIIPQIAEMLFRQIKDLDTAYAV